MISVVIVCYNEPPQRIEATLGSVFTQAFSDYELVVIDGGSRQATLDTLAEHRDRFTHFVSEPDRGIYDAMNKGIAAAAGEWVYFLNIGDELYDRDVFAGVAAQIAARPDAAVLYGRAVTERGECFDVDAPLSDDYFFDRTPCHQAVFAKRRLFAAVGGFDIGYRLVADREWMLRAFRAGAVFVPLDRTICRFEVGPVPNHRELRREMALLHGQHYRGSYGRLFTAMIARKIRNRIRTGNFRLPKL